MTEHTVWRGTRAVGFASILLASVALVGCQAPQGGTSPGETTSSGGAQAPAERRPVDNVSVTGETWQAPKVTVGDISGLGAETQRSVVSGGGGPIIDTNAQVAASIVLVDAATSKELHPYQPFGRILKLNDPQLPAFLRDVIAGVPSGSRVAALVPVKVLEESGLKDPQHANPLALVVDVQAIDPVARGAQRQPEQQAVKVTEDASGKPARIEIDSAKPAPDKLVTDVIRAGDGRQVQQGNTVTVQYTGKLYANGQTFDSSWDRGEPAQFSTDKVVKGFSGALVGQKVGSRVIAIIPPSLGYGDAEQGSIPAGSTLVFVIDILATQ